MNKLFIIGLPRTGTTSLCAALLELGYRVAHTAYTDTSFELAEVIADTPVFCDFKQLDQKFPDSKFIYLHRPQQQWLPSIQQLLSKVEAKLQTHRQAFHPLLIRCYEETFGALATGKKRSEQQLLQSYLRHRKNCEEYFRDRQNDYHIMDFHDPSSYAQLLNFLQINPAKQDPRGFPHLNANGQISAWDKIKNPLKVNSNTPGKEGRRILTCVR